MPAGHSFNICMLRSPNMVHRLCQHHLFFQTELLLNMLPQRLEAIEFSVGNTASQTPGHAVNNIWVNHQRDSWTHLHTPWPHQHRMSSHRDACNGYCSEHQICPLQHENQIQDEVVKGKICRIGDRNILRTEKCVWSLALSGRSIHSC